MSSVDDSLNRVLEQACIDLIQRNRRGEAARVEEYLRQHPELGDTAFLLDLVDAEICVRKELGESIRLDDWSQRFPHQTHAIKQLILLEASMEERVGAGSSITPGVVSTSSEYLSLSDSHSFSGIDLSSSSSEALTVVRGSELSEDSWDAADSPKPSLFPLPPIQPPKGFVVSSGVSMRPGVWLLRCRQETSQDPCAFKVIDVARLNSGQLAAKQIDALLDACERAAGIRHPVWVKALVANCDGRALGVVRPWVIGVSWRQGVGNLSTTEALRLLAELAFGLHSAHQSGSHHGNVCENNLFLTHTGDVRLTDPVNTFSRSLFVDGASPSELFREDAMMFCRLLATLQLDASRSLSTEFFTQCDSLIQYNSPDTMARMGEWLIKISDDVSRVLKRSPVNERNSFVVWLKSKIFRRNCDFR